MKSMGQKGQISSFDCKIHHQFSPEITIYSSKHPGFNWKTNFVPFTLSFQLIIAKKADNLTFLMDFIDGNSQK